MKQKLTVVKVGGAVLEDSASLAVFLDGFAAIEGAKILIHGGGRTATAMASRLGIETRMEGGRRITDAPMLEVVTMVYGGLVSRRTVAALQDRGVNALGLTGADGGCIKSVKRPVAEIDYGFVGDVESVDGETFTKLLSSGFTPVVAPLSYSEADGLLNTNADTMASCVAVALAGDYEVELVFCFEKEGIMSPSGDVIARVCAGGADSLIADGTVSGGMIPKLQNAVSAVKGGVASVRITKFDSLTGGTVIN